MSQALTRSVSAKLNMEVSGWVAGGKVAQDTMRNVAREAEKSAAKSIAAQKQVAREAEQSQRQQTASAKKAAAEQAAVANRQAADAKRRAAEIAAAQRKVGTALLGVGVVAGAAFFVAEKKAADFEVAMSAVQASTQATDDQLGQLRQTALDLGAATKFSATEAAQGITAMAKAGISAADIMGGGLKGALNLAAAGQLGVSDAAEIAATALTQFGLAGRDIPHVADLLAAGAGKAQGEVTDLAGALKYVGPVARGMGVSIDETTGALAEFAAQGIIGEQAGTSLRGVLLALTSPSEQASKTMQALGINVYDAQGQFVGLQGVAGQLQTSLGGLTAAERDEALGRIFGNTQVTAARVLYQGGAAAVRSWTEEVNDSGFAARQAAQLTNNLRGDIERLGGALDTALISGGSGSQGFLRAATQDVTGLIDTYNNAPKVIQNATTALVGFTAAAGIAGGAALIMIPKVNAAKVALTGVGISAKTTSLALRGVAAAFSITATAAAANIIGDWQGRARTSTVEATQMAAALRGLGESGKLGQDGLDGLSTVFGPLHNKVGTTQEALDRFGTSAFNALDKGWDARLGRWQSFGTRTGAFNKQVEQMDAGLAKLVQDGNADAATAAFDKLTAAAVANGVPAASVKARFTLYQQALDATTAAAVPVPDAVGAVGGAVVHVGDEAEAAAKGLQTFTDALDAFYSKTFGAEEAADAFTQSLLTLNAETKKNGDSIKLNAKDTVKHQEAVLANRDALRARSKAALDAVKALAESGASTEKVTAKTEEYRKRLYDAARAAGFSKDAAEKYSGVLRKVPKEVKTDLTLNGAQTAISAAQRLRDALLAIRDRHVTVSVATGTANRLLSNLPKPQAADGGFISGAGGPRDDMIDAKLSNGEFVINAAATKRNRPLLESINAKKFANGGPVGFAAGGPADFSTILGLVPTGTPTQGDITDLSSARARAVTSLHKAEDALAKTRKDKHHTARQIAVAEERVANARASVTRATTKLTTAERQRAAASRPYASRFLTAAGTANASDATFMRNLNTLANRGFGDLARQLLEMGGPEAKNLAGTAVKSTATAKKLSSALATSASNQASLAAAPARLAISSALATTRNPTIASISAATGIAQTDLQAAVLGMRTSLGGNSNAARLLAGVGGNAQYTGGFGPAPDAGPAVTVQVVSTGNPWLDGQKAMQGAKRELATSRGRW